MTNVAGLGPETGNVGGNVPAWWDHDYLQPLEGYRWQAQGGAWVIALFDRRRGHLYIQVND